MDLNPISDALRMQAGFESIQKGDFSNQDAVYFATIHNQSVGKTISRSPRDAIMQDGMESIMGTLREWTASASRTISNWFKDYDKQEIARIKKEVKGGAEAFKTESISDAAKSCNNVRAMIERRFDTVYDAQKLSDKSYFKGLSKKEAKEKILKEIDKTIEGLSNSKMSDFYMSQMKKNSEKYMTKIVAKIVYLKRTHVKFKNLLDKKFVYDFLVQNGFNTSRLDQIRKGGDTIIRKLEMIDKNGVVYLDIVKSKIFVDLEMYVDAVSDFIDVLNDRLQKVHKALDGADTDGTVQMGHNEYNVGDLRTVVWLSYMYMDDTLDALRSLGNEVTEDINKTSLALAGLPEYIGEAFSRV